MNAHATALIADDEPLLRDALRRHLEIVWPELEIVAEARNGREAVRLFDERHPDICFLDVHMPGLSGVDAANHIVPASVPADVAAVRPPESALRRKLVVRAHACRHSVGAHVERRPHGRWADRRRRASSDSTSAESNTGSIE